MPWCPLRVFEAEGKRLINENVFRLFLVKSFAMTVITPATLHWELFLAERIIERFANFPCRPAKHIHRCYWLTNCFASLKTKQLSKVFFLLVLLCFEFFFLHIAFTENRMINPQVRSSATSHQELPPRSHFFFYYFERQSSDVAFYLFAVRFSAPAAQLFLLFIIHLCTALQWKHFRSANRKHKRQ